MSDAPALFPGAPGKGLVAMSDPLPCSCGETTLARCAASPAECGMGRADEPECCTEEREPASKNQDVPL